jgi:ribA/ribD-fused uncharacterized protein
VNRDAPCTLCGLPRDVHAEAYGLPAGPVSNCAHACTGSPNVCAYDCAMGCRGAAHAFSGVAIDVFRGPYDFLSNFYLAPVVLCGWPFPSVEHAFQAAKCVNPREGWPAFADPKLSPAGAKTRGRAVAIRGDWEQVKVGFMRALVFDKFARHAALRERLAVTAPAYLIERNSWHDTWGDCRCGRSACGGRGHNMLGRILMEVRHALTSPVPSRVRPSFVDDLPW